ncbi:hypothetical protein [Burkholderia sp. PAMC 26561]|uniref:hypothetical protein n=1 Tax=Burkholderia sp. PAMC 26561 TaxID=1795043 RepID=UPI00076B17B6|nr:hypothetical protein [Burkholderia sp. PAMC 26561]AME23709.1 hypothetical protein AXG89_07475 [Burkholderia sp. PAMC 26561]
MLSNAVALYRALNRPQVTRGGNFEFTGTLNPKTLALLVQCEQLDEKFGRYERQALPDGTMRVEGRFPRNGEARSYSSLHEFFELTPTLATGTLPASYFIVDIDYCSFDTVKPDVIVKVERLVTFVELLTKLADDNMRSSSQANRLLFILPSDGGKVRRTALMQIRAEEEALGCASPDVGVLTELVDGENSAKLHIMERRLLMRTAISDVLATASVDTNDLTHLCFNWEEVLRQFSNNLHAYINNFAFDEVRKKIVDAELEYASKLSAVFGDIAGKLLALPVSLLAVALLDEAKTDSGFVFACAGLGVVSLVLVFVLWNLWLQAARLRSGFEFVFAPVFDKSSTYPAALRDVLDKRKLELRKQMRLTTVTFFVFFMVALGPALGAVWKLWMRFPAFGSLWSELLVYWTNFLASAPPLLHS